MKNLEVGTSMQYSYFALYSLDILIPFQRKNALTKIRYLKCHLIFHKPKHETLCLWLIKLCETASKTHAFPPFIICNLVTLSFFLLFWLNLSPNFWKGVHKIGKNCHEYLST